MSDTADRLLHDFKGEAYVHGSGVLGEAGRLAAALGQRAALVRSTYGGSDALVATVRASLAAAGVDLVGEVAGAQPNAPREDLYRIAAALDELAYDLLVVLGGGSTIDAAKAAEVLRTLGTRAIDPFFGTNQVSAALAGAGAALTPTLAIQTAASSAAHLTKYSNITDLATGQKKLIVDDAIVPARALFDYDVTATMSPRFTADGAMDGVSHSLEVLYGAVGKPSYAQVAPVASEGIRLIVSHVEQAVRNPADLAARRALGQGTDLGGYAIMIGGTNGGHLTSFSLVDVTSHGRACAMMNPYYTVFFAPAIEPALRVVGQIYRDAGLTDADVDRLAGRALGEAVAEAMFELARRIGMPVRLSELPGFTEAHIARALAAAKDPQLKMKLENMPIPMTADMVDAYMGPVLEAAATGDVGRIVNV
ncbi:MAG: iron-containing alcohol dehydrogenase [Anaerolineae bacterium]|nr:iron-containing alcohol dehydrogenase [Anaerolineae bacterium]